MVPSLDLACVVVGRRRAGELDGLAVQGSVPEKVTEVLKELQQLVGGVLKDSQNLGGHHVVDDKKRRLREKQAARLRFKSLYVQRKLHRATRRANSYPTHR